MDLQKNNVRRSIAIHINYFNDFFKLLRHYIALIPPLLGDFFEILMEISGDFYDEIP